MQRAMHLVAAGYLLFYLYGPLGQEPIVANITRFLVIPMLIVTGMVMWQLPKLSKAFHKKAEATPAARKAAVRTATNQEQIQAPNTTLNT
jgi:ABC-type transport system involved in cytochrome bd biosynthesis fused ATPase/permease subunit